MTTFKRFLTLFLCATLAVSAWAVPAYRGWQERTLTDGTSVHVRLIGDEFYHFWETQDGKIATEQENGKFVISDKQSPTSKQVIARRKAAAQRKGAARVRKNYGAIQPTKLLVLLVNFSDKSMKSTHNNAFFDNLLNGSFPSVQDYFKQSSGNTYVPEFDVFGPYTLDQNMAYYGGNDSDGNDEHPDQMVVDACAKAYADGCDFSNYDTNNDGKVDNIYVIYAGYGEAAGAPANTIWPHSWEIYSQYVSGTLKYNGKTLGHYACSAELSGKSGSNSDGVGTFAHEFSHVIGLPDYYDTDYGTNSDNGVTPGEWTLMDQGSYNGSGMYPPLYSVYDKYFMGWMTPKFLAKDEVKNVTLTTAWNDNYQITGGASRVACTNTSTVYYLENRQKKKFRVTTLENLSYLDALKVGLFQCLAVIPGTSRSGSTILGGMLLGIDRVISTEFSFFLAIPVMAGESLLKLMFPLLSVMSDNAQPVAGVYIFLPPVPGKGSVAAP